MRSLVDTDRRDRRGQPTRLPSMPQFQPAARCQAASAAPTQFRPARFASYTAASACAYSCAGRTPLPLIAPAQLAAHRVGHIPQHRVTDRLAVLVVDALEVVDVGHQKAERGLGA